MWPFHHRHKSTPSPDAMHAVECAARQLKDTERMADRVDEVADHLAEIRRQNHIALALVRAIRGV